MASDNGSEGFKLSDDPVVLNLQLQVLQLRREYKAAFANAATPSPTVKKLKPLPTVTPARTSHSTPNNLSVAEPPLEIPQEISLQSLPSSTPESSPCYRDILGWKRLLADALPAINNSVVEDPKRLKTVISEINNLRRLHADILPRIFAICVLAKCTGKAAPPVAHFDGEDPSLTWDQVKEALERTFLTDLVHIDPFFTFGSLLLTTSQPSRLSVDQIVSHGESLTLHESICGVTDWKLFQTLTLCRFSHPALYRFIITPSPPTSLQELLQRARRYGAQNQSQPPAGPRSVRTSPRTSVPAPPPSSQPRGKLSAEMRQYRLDNKLCLYCGDHAAEVHPCPKKRTGAPPRIMSMETLDEPAIPSNA
jgi:hypothetical protein